MKPAPEPPTTMRGDTRIQAATSSSRFDTAYSVSADPLTNARTRIVGNRTGFFADLIIGIIRLARAVSRAAAGLHKRLSGIVTALGWSMLVLVPGCLWLGYRLGWLELVSVAYAGLVLLIVGAAYLVGKNAFAVELDVGRSRVVVGERASGTVSVSNTTRHRLLGTKIEIPIGRGLSEIVMPSLAHRTTFRHEFPIPTAKRGVYSVGPVRTVRADPIGLVRRELVWTDSSEFFVHPRTIVIPSTSTGFIRDLEGTPTKDLSNSDISFHALREYVAGDERRYIHWKSTAKTGTYMVRQFEETRRSHLVIALSLASADYASDEEFELAVSVAGSLGVRAIQDAMTVSVVASEMTPEFAARKIFAVKELSTVTPSRLLDDLSIVDRAESALSIRDVARVTADKVAGISVAFLVCGSLATPSALSAASTKFALGVEVIAVVCDPDTVPGLRRAAGLSVLTIGYLEDLKKSLARAAAV